MNEVNKPVSLIRDELVSNIVSAMNESKLSYFILDYILKDIWTEVHNGAIRQAQAEKNAYLQQQSLEGAPKETTTE